MIGARVVRLLKEENPKIDWKKIMKMEAEEVWKMGELD